jgi:hypothetical protein
MLAGMTPRLTGGEFTFCTMQDAELIARALALVAGSGKRGTTFILALTEVRKRGFSGAKPMRRIRLEMFSALNGGLAVGIATAPAQENIPCNMVAGYHHDPVFVPAALAERAEAVLINVAARAQLRSD